MKYIIIIGDGMSDYPLKELDGRTPLEVSETPNMDFIAGNGKCGLLKTLRDGLPLGSDVANLMVLGYNPEKYYTGGRGPLEAASIGVNLRDNDIAFRCNFITVEDGRIKDYSAGHISSPEGKELIKALEERFSNEEVKFYPGVSYRNILILLGDKYSVKVRCMPPHDIIGKAINKNLVQPLDEEGMETADLLNKIILKSSDLLENHPINLKREKEGKSKANSVWFWGQGRKPVMPSFYTKYGIKGALISAVDLLRGIAIYLGMEVVDVPGITGYLDTNYEGKADYALKALERNDLVYIHVESTDEASHEGSIEKKIKALEDLDKRLIGRILKALSVKETDFSIAVLPDHATPIRERTHTADEVPFAIYRTGGEGDKVKKYTEKEAANGSFGVKDALEFMDIFLHE